MRPNRPFMNGGLRPNGPFQHHRHPMMNAPARPWFNPPQGFMMNNNVFRQFRGPPSHMQIPTRTFPNNPPRPLLNSPSWNKRQMTHEENDGSRSKRAKVNDSTPAKEDQYEVPCSRGTEQITVSIWEYFLKSRMVDDDMEKKLMLQKTLHSIIKEAFPESRLFIVGSSMTGFATRTSDVDMCLVISDKELNQKKEAPVILTALLKALRNCSFVNRPLVIRAKVPILKFRDTVSGFECDININNTIGIRNTHLLRYYAHMDWRVRPLILYIKNWARFHDINDASKKTISSYSLSLMLLHYLQAGVKPPVLPCLQALKPKLFSAKNDVRKISLQLEKIDFTSSNKSTLGELFLGFLDYYANVFAYDRDVVSVRRGKKISQYDVDHSESDWKFLCIEEPFEGTNTARSVYDHYVFMRILRVFSASFNLLQRTRNSDSILQYPL